MTFPYVPFHEYELEQITTPQGRHYIDQEGHKFDSVTTIISRASDQRWLEEWRQRIGFEAANAITERALVRGTELHLMAENFLRGNAVSDKNVSAFQRKGRRLLREALQANVRKIYGIEFRLHSLRLKAAGTADLICDWDGKTAIVDFKTCNEIKREDQILNYFIQSSVYALMVEELYDVVCDKIVIIMVPDAGEPKIFDRCPYDYQQQLEQIFIGNRQ